MKPRGIRNHNPGNVRDYGAAWRGLAEPAEMTNEQLEEDQFCVFVSALYGIRCLAKLLTGYQKLHNLYTVRGIIDRYAPPVENDTSSYVDHVSLSMGVGADNRIDLADPFELHLMIEAIIRHENGSNPYPYYMIEDAMLLARET